MARPLSENKRPQDELRKAESNIKSFADAAKDEAENIKDQVAERARSAGRALSSWYEEKKHQAIDIRDKAEDNIKSHPFSSAAVAFAAGIIVAKILGRRK